ncbi:hypothetical protein [Rubellicoccus peritrichatus]|uniref:Uncharacterized protein n=1 Tax=Rubellicoccus peritrichatus TaxID=3080537 RepID=A0AAQ3L661_9BACT|nr:hypothetical protein [Puniceicoccus sp. CR14]WOO39651.1 hypothetical protein RZN69_13590 [Puniceicoccus sp. CR14]
MKLLPKPLLPHVVNNLFLEISIKVRKSWQVLDYMKDRITKGISFPDEEILQLGQERAKNLGLRSFSEYINQLIRHDNGLPNIFDGIQKSGTSSILNKEIEAKALAEKEKMLAKAKATKKVKSNKSA